MGAANRADYPAGLDAIYPERSSRLLAVLLILLFIKAVLAIPHFIILALYGLAAALIGFIAQWIVLFTGRYPQGFFNFVLGNMQWSWRVTAWVIGLTDRYPPFSSEASEGYPASASCERPETSHRGLAIIRIIPLIFIAAIPHLIVLYILNIAALVVIVFSPWAVLFTGRFPHAFFDFAVGFYRWQFRVNCFTSGLADSYPPFRLSA